MIVTNNPYNMFIVKATSVIFSDIIKAGAMTFRRAILDRTTFGKIVTLSRTENVQTRHSAKRRSAKCRGANSPLSDKFGQALFLYLFQSSLSRTCNALGIISA